MLSVTCETISSMHNLNQEAKVEFLLCKSQQDRVTLPCEEICVFVWEGEGSSLLCTCTHTHTHAHTCQIFLSCGQHAVTYPIKGNEQHLCWSAGLSAAPFCFAQIHYFKGHCSNFHHNLNHHLN